MVRARDARSKERETRTQVHPGAGQAGCGGPAGAQLRPEGSAERDLGADREGGDPRGREGFVQSLGVTNGMVCLGEMRGCRV